MRVDVAFTPAAGEGAPTGIAVDVIRATSTICQALAAGYRGVYCAAEVSDAMALRDELPGIVLGGERHAVLIPGFDLGNSPREYVEPRGDLLALSTTNGTRAIVAAAGHCERVLVASLLNLEAVVCEAREHRDDVVVYCAGVEGAPALDDTYVAGRIAAELGYPRTDAAETAVRLADSYASAEEAFRASRSGHNLLENAPELEADISFCARESVLAVAPRLVEMRGTTALVAL